MYYLNFAVRIFSFAVLMIIAGAVAWMIYNGDIDVRQWLVQVAPSIGQGASTILVLGVAVCFLLAAIAPLIYAARSGDLFTIVVSIVALVVCFILISGSRTVIDMVLAAIVYFTSAFISVIMYSTNRIVDQLRGGPTAPIMQRDRAIADRAFN
jgi:hypothetical protein